VLQQLHKTVKQLSEAEKVRQDTTNAVALKKRAQGGLGGLARWAAGGAVTAKSPEEEIAEARDKTLSAHREGVVGYLQKRLEQAGKIQAGMMEARLQREEEKSKSVLFKSKGADIPYEKYDPSMLPGGDQGGRERQAGGAGEMENELSEEQLQVFQEENQEMTKHYQDQLGQVRWVAFNAQGWPNTICIDADMHQSCITITGRNIRTEYRPCHQYRHAVITD